MANNDFLRGFAIGQKVVGALGDSAIQINDAIKQQRTDRIAQQLGQEAGVVPVPSAVAVDPAIEAQREQQYGAPVKPANLKTDDIAKLLRLQSAVSDIKQQKVIDSLRSQENTRAWNADARAGQYLNLQQQQEQRLEQQTRDANAARAAGAASSKMKEAVTDADAYHSGVAATIPKIQNARTRQDYEAQVAALQSLYSGAVTRGLKVDPVSVPPFRGDVISDAQKAYQKNANSDVRAQIVARLRQLGIDPREAGIQTNDSAQTPPWMTPGN